MRLTQTCLLALTLAFVAQLAFSTDADGTPAQPGHFRTIFRCEIAGVPTFSDRPCGSATESRTAELNTVNIIEPPAIDAAPESARVGKRHGNAAGEGRSPAARKAAKADPCERLQQSLRKVTSKMRTGYTAKEGERLRMRKKDLEEKRRMQKCR